MAKPLVIIVEDHQDHVTILESAFSMAGFETEVIGDGAVARDRLKEVVPAVVVLDLNLPKVSGEELLYQIRLDDRLADVKVLVSTADQALADELQISPDLILIKPCSFVHLRSLAEEYYPK